MAVFRIDFTDESGIKGHYTCPTEADAIERRIKLQAKFSHIPKENFTIKEISREQGGETLRKIFFKDKEGETS